MLVRTLAHRWCFCLLVLVCQRVSLCNPNGPQTLDPPASAAQVLGMLDCGAVSYRFLRVWEELEPAMERCGEEIIRALWWHPQASPSVHCLTWCVSRMLGSVLTAGVGVLYSFHLFQGSVNAEDRRVWWHSTEVVCLEYTLWTLCGACLQTLCAK